MTFSTDYVGSKLNVKDLKKGGKIARSPRPNTPGPIAFLMPKPGQKIHPAHAAWDAKDPERLAHECFLAFISVDNIYICVAQLVASVDRQNEIIGNAGRETAEIRRTWQSVRRGRAYLHHPARERAMQILADRYPDGVSITELCLDPAIGTAQAPLLRNVLQRHRTWFKRTKRGHYALKDEDIRDAVQQRVLDAQRAQGVLQFKEGFIKKCGGLGSTMSEYAHAEEQANKPYDPGDNDARLNHQLYSAIAKESAAVQRYVNSTDMAGSALKTAHDAGTLQDLLFSTALDELDLQEKESDLFDFESELGILPAEPENGNVDQYFKLFQVGDQMKASEMYTGYVEWCGSLGLPPLSQTRFGTLVRSSGFSVKHTREGKICTKLAV